MDSNLNDQGNPDNSTAAKRGASQSPSLEAKRAKISDDDASSLHDQISPDVAIPLASSSSSHDEKTSSQIKDSKTTAKGNPVECSGSSIMGAVRYVKSDPELITVGGTKAVYGFTNMSVLVAVLVGIIKGMDGTSGILLHSLDLALSCWVVRLLARVSGFPLNCFGKEDIRSKPVDTAVELLGSLFKKLRSEAPSILFLNQEVFNSDDSSQSALLGEFESQWNRLVNERFRVIVVAHTSAPWRISTGMYRARFQYSAILDLPDHSIRRNFAWIDVDHFTPCDLAEGTIDRLATKSEGLSMSDIFMIGFECRASLLRGAPLDWKAVPCCWKEIQKTKKLWDPDTLKQGEKVAVDQLPKRKQKKFWVPDASKKAEKAIVDQLPEHEQKYYFPGVITEYELMTELLKKKKKKQITNHDQDLRKLQEWVNGSHSSIRHYSIQWIHEPDAIKGFAMFRRQAKLARESVNNAQGIIPHASP